jgi:peptidoglycan/xylan/chitin deacetylase (PgdA/CDA1 family)
LRSQLDIALPQLDAAGFKGTFFLSGTFAQEDVERWRTVAAAGHELGNHSVFHPCAKGSFDMPERYNSERYSVPTMLTEIRVMNTLLHAIDGKTEHTYATPCGQTVVGGEDYLPALRTSGLVKYVRNAAPMASGALDPFNVPGMFFPETVTGPELIAFVEAARQRGGLGVLGFHGVGGDYLKVSSEAHQQLVQYLHDHQDTVWVTTFRQAMDYAETAH